MNIKNINKRLQNEILILDGAMGSLIQAHNLSEKDFRGSRFKNHSCNLKGFNDILCLTQNGIIRSIHKAYLEAGADIIETNSFNANLFSLKDYDLEEYCYQINFEAGKAAIEERNNYFQKTGKYAFVAGSIGPSSKTASIVSNPEKPDYREVSFDDFQNAYREQITALIDSGVDILIIETIFDPLSAKAVLIECENIFETKGKRLPVIISATLTNSGRILSGHSIDAFYEIVKHFKPHFQYCSALGFYSYFFALLQPERLNHIK
jgi:5-methyltetrahydrofolate--homocysteine methyltransferase